VRTGDASTSPHLEAEQEEPVKGSLAGSDLRQSAVFGVVGILALSAFVTISYVASGELDRVIGDSWWLLPIGVLSLVVAFSKVLGVVSGTSDDLGSSTTFSCSYCKRGIRTSGIPMKGHNMTCPHCGRLLSK
jgi:DNA-directed RNA polymerase subunit RPC12/RpoP